MYARTHALHLKRYDHFCDVVKTDLCHSRRLS